MKRGLFIALAFGFLATACKHGPLAHLGKGPLELAHSCWGDLPLASARYWLNGEEVPGWPNSDGRVAQAEKADFATYMPVGKVELRVELQTVDALPDGGHTLSGTTTETSKERQWLRIFACACGPDDTQVEPRLHFSTARYTNYREIPEWTPAGCGLQGKKKP
jgi:hypothetical protein